MRAWPVEARAERVTQGDVVAEVLGVGTLESAREVRVSFEASGRVTSLAADEGGLVAEGDLLGNIDASDAARELAVSAEGEHAAEAAVQRARAELERARVAVARATTERERADKLAAGGVIHASDHEAAIEREDTAKAEARALEAALVQSERSRDVAGGSRRIRAAQLEDGQLRSPLSGLVVARDVEVGQLVTPGAPAFTIVATDTMRVRAWVDEASLGRLAVGQPARLVFRSEVDVAVLELPANFAVGQRADARIEVGRSPGVGSVPRGWCDTACDVVAEGRVTPRAVTLGLVGRDRVEVLDGIGVGDLVLAPGAPAGKRVRAVEAL